MQKSGGEFEQVFGLHIISIELPSGNSRCNFC